MQVDIRLVGTDSEWKLPGPRIRVGRDPGCDIALNPAQFPMVSREHIVLLVEHGHVRFSDCGSANGTYVNGVKTAQGRLLNSDRIRLGSDGPELEVTLSDDVTAIVAAANVPGTPPVSLNAPTLVSSSDAATTMLLQSNEPVPAQRQGGNQSATVISTQEKTVQLSAGNMAPTRVEQRASIPLPPAASGAHADIKTVYISDAKEASPSLQSQAQVEARPQNQPQPNASRAKQAPEVESSSNRESELSEEQEEMIEQKLNSLQKLVYLLVAILVVMLGFVIYQSQQLDKNRVELNDMRNQAGNALAQAVPALDARLKTFDDRLDSVDGKMKAEEDHMVERLHSELETEMPKLMDKYLDSKMKQLNSQVPQIPR